MQESSVSETEEDEEEPSEENPAIDAAVQELSNAEEPRDIDQQPSVHSSQGTLTPEEPAPPQADEEQVVPSPPAQLQATDDHQLAEDSPPAEQPVESPPAEQPVESPPAEQPVESPPAEQPVAAEQPVVVQVTQQPVQRSPKLQTPDKTQEKECSQHHMVEQIFCEKCDKPICPACLRDGHDKHDWHPKSDYVNMIANKEQDIASARQQLAEMISDSDQRMEQTSAQQASVKDFIDKQADRLHSLINDERTALLKMTEDASSRQTSLLQQRKDIAIQFDKFFVDASAHCDPDKATEAVQFYKQLIESIEANLKDAGKSAKTPLPAEAQISAAMKDSPTENVLQSIQSQFGQAVTMRQPAGPADISVTGSGAKRAIVGLQAMFTITTIKDPDKLPCVFSSSISIALLARDNQKTTRIDCVCKKEAEDKVTVSYTANKPGVYSLQIKVGQDCLFSRSTTVLVSPPIAYEKKVTAVKRLHSPCGIVVNANGMLAIVETSGNSITLKELGKSRKHFGKKGSNEGQLLSPTGVTFAAGQSQILVADTGNHRVQRFDYKGKLVASVGSKGEEELQFNTPVDIAVDTKKRVYVAEAGNGRIQVLSSDFFFQQFIRCPQGATPTGVSVDSENMLYVSYQELYVQKLHPDGQYVCNIGAVHLTNPSCIFISQFDIVYVGDRGTNSVIIFSGNGEFLQQIDNRSESVQPSEFGSPGGLAVDTKNNLYVSDSDNGRMLIFRQAN